MRRYGFCGLIIILCFCILSNVIIAADGWASMDGGTTGGAGGTIVTADNAADFISYVQGTGQDPYIIYVSGHIDLGGSSIRVRGNKTIIGLPGSRITGNLKSFRIEESNNIFRYLSMDNQAGAGDGDCITIDSANHIWIDHCTFTNGDDGMIDIKNGADYVTVSWCIFQYTYDSGHNYTNLVGHSDGNADKDMDHLLVTFHHNWYSTLSHERMPSVRFGKAHIYNSYFDTPGNRYCIRTRLYAQCLIENNYFKDVQNPWERYTTTTGDDPGLAQASGNIFDNVTWYVGYDSKSTLIDGTDTVFTPPYSYTLDDAQDVPAIVQWGAGVDGKEGYPPHWYSSYYGDFDNSGLVDLDDLVTFAGYWLDTADISDADYDASGRVDNAEFALFANHWYRVPDDVTAPAVPANLSALAGDGVVNLNWDDNSEPDLDGYNIYRSTTSQTGYVKLNPSLLTDSNYTDTTVVNNNVYFYVIKAVDTSSNESAASSEVSAFPVEAGAIIIQENATGFCSVDGIVDLSGEHAGYTGVGYLDTTNAIGSGAVWRVHADTAGTYTLTWRYANGSSARPGRLLVNTIEQIVSINFAATGAWTTWTTVTADAVLAAGDNDIRLEATTSGGLANIDYLHMTGSGITAVSCQ